MSASRDTMLRLSGVHANYGKVRALHGVDVEVRRGEIVCLIGANGAGKSTTLGCISQVVPTAAGVVEFEGRDLRGVEAADVVRRGLVQVPEGRRIFSRMSVGENLALGAATRRDADGVAKDRAHVFELFPILRDRIAQPGGTLSGGEQQMLAIGRAMMAKPRLLMMDEPSMGIAPILVARIFEAIRALREGGVTILLVEQNARAALAMSDRGYVLETGKVTLSGSGQELLDDPRVRQAYLGE